MSFGDVVSEHHSAAGPILGTLSGAGILVGMAVEHAADLPWAAVVGGCFAVVCALVHFGAAWLNYLGAHDRRQHERDKAEIRKLESKLEIANPMAFRHHIAATPDPDGID